MFMGHKEKIMYHAIYTRTGMQRINHRSGSKYYRHYNQTSREVSVLKQQNILMQLLHRVVSYHMIRSSEADIAKHTCMKMHMCFLTFLAESTVIFQISQATHSKTCHPKSCWSCFPAGWGSITFRFIRHSSHSARLPPVCTHHPSCGTAHSLPYLLYCTCFYIFWLKIF